MWCNGDHSGLVVWLTVSMPKKLRWKTTSVDCGVRNSHRNRGSRKSLIIFTAGPLDVVVVGMNFHRLSWTGTPSVQVALTVLMVRRHISGASPFLPICSLAPPWLWICATWQPQLQSTTTHCPQTTDWKISKKRNETRPQLLAGKRKQPIMKILQVHNKRHKL